MTANLKARNVMPKLKSFGDRLKWARENVGYSQEELGDLSGYSQKQISNLESGVTERPRKISNLSKHLDVSPAWLMFGLEELDNLDKRAIDLAITFDSLSDDDKKSIELLIKRLTNPPPPE